MSGWVLPGAAYGRYAADDSIILAHIRIRILTITPGPSSPLEETADSEKQDLAHEE